MNGIKMWTNWLTDLSHKMLSYNTKCTWFGQVLSHNWSKIRQNLVSKYSDFNLSSCPEILESTEDNFLMQVINDSTRRDALLDLLLVDKEEMVENVKGSLGYSKHEAVEFMIHRREQEKKQNYNPRLQKSQCWSSQDLFWRSHWKSPLRAKGLDIFQQKRLWSITKVHSNIKIVKQVWHKACKHKHGALSECKHNKKVQKRWK